MITKIETKTIITWSLGLLLFFWAPTCLFSKTISINFDHLNASNSGLSSNRILSLCRDSRGFIWIGTQAGLNRYDGYSTVTYYNDTANNTSLSHDNVYSIFEDSKKQIWVATHSGLCLFNRKTESFKVYKFVRPDEKKISTRPVFQITEDQLGNIWVGLGKSGGFRMIDQKGSSHISYKVQNSPDSNAFNTITDLAFDSQGLLWLGTMGNGLVCFEPLSKKFTLYSDSNIDLGVATFKRLFFDNTSIWILTEGKGLFKFDLISKKFYKIPINEDGTGTNGAFIRCMIRYDKTHLFIGVDQGGINSLNTETGKIEYYKYNELNSRSLANNGVWSMQKDKEGILWVGTSAAGISYYNPKKERFKLYQHTPDPNSLSYNAILCFHEDKQGNIWIGTDGGGLNIFNPTTESFTILKHDPLDPKSIGSNVILSIDEDTYNNIWMGTWSNGLIRYNRTENKFYQYLSSKNNPNTIGSDNIWNLMVDNKNNLWLSNFDYGIDIYDNNKFTRRFRYDPIITKPEEFYRINIFYKGRKDKIWVLRGGMVSLLDSSRTEIKNVVSLGKIAIFSFYEDRDENIWVGTNSKGIFCYDKDAKLLYVLNTSTGLPNNTVLGILEDEHNNLWIGTNAGICRFNISSKKVTCFPQNDALQKNNYKEWAYLKSKNGTFYFGGYSGFKVFHPDSIKKNDYLPYIYFNDLQIFGKSVKIGEYDSILRQNISETKSITLKHSISVFSISFTAISHTFPENNLYAYKMEGFDDDWIIRNASRRYVTYTNLDPGEYVFKVKAANNDEVWNEKAASIKIIILPPWWKTLWFKLLSISLIIIAFTLFYLYKVIRVKEKNLLLEKLVKERTQEISMQNEEILTQKELLEKKNALLLEHENEMEAQNDELQAQAEELQAQSEELYNQTKALAFSNERIQKQHDELENAYKELSMYRTHLESLVEERTKELIVAKEKAEESDRLKSSFLANLSHEIRTPINAIIGFSEILSDKNLTDNERENFNQIIARSSDTLLNLINDVIDFSKIEAGFLKVNITNVNLNKITRLVTDIFNLELKRQNSEAEKNIDFKVEISEKCESAVISTDEIRLMQIISNLINNAIKFTQKGEIVFGCRIDEQHKNIQLYVKDTGIGIEEKNFKIIFERFRKVEDNKNQLYRGAGLGLAISSELINLLGGKISVKSELGKGSEFVISIPLSENLNEKNKFTTINSKEVPNFSGIHILIAEDDTNNYLFLEKILKKTNAILYSASDGIEAVSKVKEKPELNLVLMDIKMPNMDGIQALKAIRLFNSTIPIIAQTAHALADEIVSLKEAGFDRYITKPIKPAVIYNTIQDILFENRSNE